MKNRFERWLCALAVLVAAVIAFGGAPSLAAASVLEDGALAACFSLDSAAEEFDFDLDSVKAYTPLEDSAEAVDETLSTLSVPSSAYVSGTSGSCTWYITSGNELVIEPTNGSSGTLANYDGSTYPEWADYYEYIGYVTVKSGVSANTQAEMLFAFLVYASSWNVSKLDTSQTTDMMGMFALSSCYYEDTGITSTAPTLSLSSWDVSQATDMSLMFYEGGFGTIKASGWDTGAVELFDGTFQECVNLTSITGTGSWDTSSAVDMTFMFANCESLTAVSLVKWDTSHVESMEGMFYCCYELTTCDPSAWDTSSLIYADLMFFDCESLPSLDLALWDVSQVVYFDFQFSYCLSLASLDLSGWETSSALSMGGIFAYCTALEELDLSGFDCSGLLVEYDEDADDYTSTGNLLAFNGCESLSRVTFGSAWQWVYDADYETYLPTPATAYGTWIRTDGTLDPLTPEELTEGWSADLAGTWVWYTDDFSIDATELVRLGGTTRYTTMAKIVLEAYGDTGSEYAVIATGTNFADALTAASLAGVLDAPIILVADGNEALGLRLLEQLGVSKAYIVGGTAAVSSSIESQVKALGIAVTRLAGETRVETAQEIAAETLAISGSSASTTCIVAAGSNFPDALSISPYSYWSGSPIYLANTKTGTVSSDVISDIMAGGYDTVIIVGGTSVVSLASQRALGTISGVTVTRLAGDTRYDTSVEIAEWSVEQGMSYDGAAVATGANFPDALAGATLCGRTGSVILLVKDDKTQTIDLLAENTDGVSLVYFLGGTSAVSEELYDAVAALV